MKKYTIREKNNVVVKYLSGERTWKSLLLEHNKIDNDTLFAWIMQYRTRGSTLLRG